MSSSISRPTFRWLHGWRQKLLMNLLDSALHEYRPQRWDAFDFSRYLLYKDHISQTKKWGTESGNPSGHTKISCMSTVKKRKLAEVVWTHHALKGTCKDNPAWGLFQEEEGEAAKRKGGRSTSMNGRACDQAMQWERPKTERHGER